MYHPAGARQKDVSTRLIKPTLPDIDADHVLNLVSNWNPNWEVDGGISIYDEGIAQYLLTDTLSHEKFFAALILRKPSLRCRIISEEPRDVLDEERGNHFTIHGHNNGSLSDAELKQLEFLKDVLSRRGFRFAN